MASLQCGSYECLVLLLVLVSVNAQNTYIIAAPEVVRPNSEYGVAVNILPSVQGDVNIKLELHKNNSATGSSDVKAVKEMSVASGESAITLLELTDLTSGDYFLRVSGNSPATTFTNDSILSFSSKQHSLFIQTDKAIYKAGQMVHFRVIAITPDLLPAMGQVDVNILDPSGNRIKQWNDVELERGVATFQIELSDQPVLGDWKVQVDLSEESEEKTFTVDEYVLPKFEVKVNLPPYYLGKSFQATGTVEAMYTYGKPVKGSLVVTISVPHYQNKIVKTVKKEITGTTDFSVNFELDVDEDIHLMATVKAELTEMLTGLKVEGEASTEVHQKDVKMEFSGPQYFKPGLAYTVYLKVTKQDGSPLLSTNTPKVQIKYQFDYTDSGSFMEYEIPKEGVIPLMVYPSLETRVIVFSAKHEEALDVRYNVSPFRSLSNAFLQLTKEETKLKAGDSMTLNVNSTLPISLLSYQVMCKGGMVKADRYDAGNKKMTSFNLDVTPEMSPEAYIIAFFVKDNEVIADGLQFDVDGAFKNEITVAFDVSKAEPGDDVSVRVDTDPDSFVGLLAVDQSVQLLKSGNDITQEEVIEELSKYGKTSSDSHGPRPMPLLRHRWWPWFQNSGSAAALIKDAGLVFLTDAFIYGEEFRYRCPGCEPVLVEFALAGAVDEDLDIRMDGDFKNKVVEDSAPADTTDVSESTRVRKLFPETWLWLNASTTSETGVVVMNTVVPDTITSWLATGFSMNEKNGIAVTEQAAQLTAFRPFFVSLNLPYSVKRGEELDLQATVFNYMDEDVKVVVTLHKSEDFDNIPNEIVADINADQKKQETIKKGDGMTFVFPILPTKIGHIPIKVSAQTKNAQDAVERQLLVKAEGVPRYHAQSILIESNAEVAEVNYIDIVWPDHVVNGSRHVEAAVTGDVMGSTISNLGNLLKMPFGCGEQNMLNFAPNIFVTNYLLETEQLKSDVKDKAVRFMEIGYQRELTYQRKDGSFSAFGNSDDQGSMWLTAFVAKSFRQAKKHIYIDFHVIEQALLWMVKQQQKDGHFREPGRVIHKDMQGGAASGVSLTAYAMVALLENAKKISNEETKQSVLSSVSQAQGYLESQLQSVEHDPYALAITTYALILSESKEAENALQLLDKLAVDKGGLKHWIKKQLAETSDQHSFYPRHSSVDIEMTAYALLTMVKKKNLSGGIPIMKWLMRQQNSFGGFASTQDTVIGLQSLSEFAAMVFSSSEKDVTFTIEAGDFSHQFLVDDSNSLVYQTVELPVVDSVDIYASGFGTGLVQVKWSYNVEQQLHKPAFFIQPKVIKNIGKSLQVEVCTKYQKDGGDASGMTVVELHMPSGYVADTGMDRIKDTNSKNIKDLQRIETVDGNTVVNMYYNSIGQSTTCVVVDGFQAFDVKKTKQTATRAFDYYNTDDEAVAFYTVSEPQELRVLPPDEGDGGDDAGASASLINLLLIIFIAAVTTMLFCT